jgi:anti-anti-sigma regulatory factor
MAGARGLRVGNGTLVDAITGVLLVQVHGRLDRRTTAQLADCLERGSRQGRPVVVDLCEIDELEWVAVDALVEARSGLGVRLRLAAPRGGPALRALREAGLAHTFGVHSSRAAAMAAAAPRH